MTGRTTLTVSAWFACRDPRPMLDWLPATETRRLRLFAAAACREVWDRLSEPGRMMVLAAEQWADGDMTRLQLTNNCSRLQTRMCENARDRPSPLDAAAVGAATPTKSSLGDLIRDLAIAAPGAAAVAQALARQAALLHDIFDGQFYALAVPAGAFAELSHAVAVAPEWRTYNALGVARGIYAERAFDRMPILADALEDAGCDSPEVLDHCRGDQPHARGCWVVDQVLGKS